MGRFGSVLLTCFLAGPSAAAPVGLALRLPPWATVLAVSVGAAASFVIALFATEWLRAWWQSGSLRGLLRWWGRWSLLGRLGLYRRLDSRWRRRREARRARRGTAGAQRARRLLDRIGPAGFGLVGPALFGTWVSAALGTALGLARWRLLGWLVVGATLWSALLVLASHTVLGWLFT